jgi:hypothetical protein
VDYEYRRNGTVAIFVASGDRRGGERAPNLPDDDKCLLHVAGDDPGTPWPPVLLARNGGIKPLLDELLRHEGNRVLVDIECFGGARVRPCGAFLAFVHFEENPGAHPLLRRRPLLLQERLEDVPFIACQLDDVSLVCHGRYSSWGDISR